MTVPMIKSIGDVPYPIDTHSDAFSPLLTAGAALGITGDGPTESAAWLQRVSTSGGPTTIRSIHGRTLRWNQLAPNIEGDTWYAASNTTVTRDEDKITATIVADGSGYRNSVIATQNVTGLKLHKYLVSYYVLCAKSATFAADLFNSGSTTLASNTAGVRSHIAAIMTFPNNDTITPSQNIYLFPFDAMVAGDTFTVDTPQVYDLTTMFGAGNEPSTVAEFEALYPLPYYEYDAGSLLPVNMTGIATDGFNQLDPENVRTDIFIDNSTSKVGAGTRTQTAIVEVFPNTDYCLTYTGGNRCVIAGVDSMTPAVGDEVRVIFGIGSARVSPKVFNSGNNRYVACYVANIEAQASNICINISDPTRNGEYEPYWHQERTISAGTLRSAGSVYDELTETERITRVGAVDLGTLTWNRINSGDVYIFQASISAMIQSGRTTDLSCSGYTVMDSSGFGLADKCCTRATGSRTVYVRDDAYTDAAAFKTAMSGVMLHYALATPTTTPIDPQLNLTYRTAAGGTERVMVPTGELSAPPTIVTAQGYTAESLRDAALATIAPVENGLASTNYAVGSYLVHGGQLCKVTTAIATGEAITIGTNVTATTVMAEVIALIAQ